MKLNARNYNRVVTKPFETEKLKNGSVCELYYMNENPFFMEYTARGRFAVWSTLDEKTFRLFVEKGYYDVTKELYGQKVNSIWAEYYSEISKIEKSYKYKFLIPIVALYAALSIVLLLITQNPVAVVGVMIAFFLTSILSRKKIYTKMKKENYEAVNRIKKHIGNKKFDSIIQAQQEYIEKFFDFEEPENDIEEIVENNEEVIENTDEEIK